MEHDNTSAAYDTHIHVKNMRLTLTDIRPAQNPAAYDQLRLETARQLAVIFRSHKAAEARKEDTDDL